MLTWRGVLCSGVVVLHGSDEKRRAMEAAVHGMCRGCSEAEDARAIRVTLRDEGDQIKVNGHETEIRVSQLRPADAV